MSKESEVLVSDIKRLLSYVSEDKHEEFSAILGEYTTKLCDYALSEFINALKKDIQDNPIEYFETDSESKSQCKLSFTNEIQTFLKTYCLALQVLIEYTTSRQQLNLIFN